MTVRDGTEAGFTLVELIIATLVIVIGLLGAFKLLDGALRATQANNARVGAVNLARQLTESARTLDYDSDLRPDGGALPGIAAALQTKPGLAGSGNPWNIVRRGVTYSVAASVCTFDDPKDGLAVAPVTPPDNACTPAATAIAGAPAESNPDDFRRVTITLSWQRNGATKTMRQTALIANPSGGLGPRITTFAQPTTQFTAFPQIANGTTGPEIQLPLTTSAANNVHWTVDSVGTDGEATAVGTAKTSWTIKWPIGSIVGGVYAPGAVVDGTYAVDAQPFNDRGIPGETRTAAVALNRIAPLAPANAAGGRNQIFSGGGIVDLEWRPANAGERDILGYRVYRPGPDGVPGNGNDELVTCAGQPALLPNTASSCADLGPESTGAVKYFVVAVDRDSAGALREGDTRLVSIAAPGAQPAAPAGPLTATTNDSQPTLSWSAPSSGAVAFYRIYRDGTAVQDRIDRTAGSATSWVDGSPGSGSHQYWVTAVDASYNESNPIGPVVWSP